MYNVIGDIAGNYKTLLRLLAKMPEGTPVSVGDMIDRGPSGNQVLEFFRDNGLAVYGNHEDMMVDYIKQSQVYYNDCWFMNGGKSTWFSINHDPETYCKYVESLPKFLVLEADDKKLLVTHAPVNPVYGLERQSKLDNYNDHSLLWNRGKPKRIPEYALQVFGHNSSREVVEYKEYSALFAVGIDTSKGGKLTGLHWPSGEIFEEIIDED